MLIGISPGPASGVSVNTQPGPQAYAPHFLLPIDRPLHLCKFRSISLTVCAATPNALQSQALRPFSHAHPSRFLTQCACAPRAPLRHRLRTRRFLSPPSTSLLHTDGRDMLPSLRSYDTSVSLSLTELMSLALRRHASFEIPSLILPDSTSYLSSVLLLSYVFESTSNPAPQPLPIAPSGQQ